MKTDLEELSPTRVRLTVEVPFDELEPSIDAAYKKVARQVRVPGFRPGKVPPTIIDQRFGRGVVLEQAVNDALPGLYGQAVQERELRALGQPEVEITKLEDRDQLAFTAEVDVRPRFDVPDYEKLAVQVDDAEVTPDEVEEQLGMLRERFAALRAVERAVEHGDYVTVDLSTAVDGEPVEEASASGMSHEVGGPKLLDGLDDALVGMSAGESTTFTTALASGEYAGREAEVTVTVHSVKVKDLPEVDDEFAQSASEFDTIGELRADLRERMISMKRSQQVSQARERALDILLERVDIPLPESVVDEEIQRRRQSIDQQLQSAGLTKEQYLETQEMTSEQFENDLAEGARRSIKVGFLLDKVAEKEELQVSESDLTTQIVNQAMRMGVAPNQLAQYLSDSGQVGPLMAEILREKALDLMVEHLAVTDDSGRTVDIKAIREEQAGTSSRESDEDVDEHVDEHVDEVVDDDDGELEGVDDEEAGGAGGGAGGGETVGGSGRA